MRLPGKLFKALIFLVSMPHQSVFSCHTPADCDTSKNYVDRQLCMCHKCPVGSCLDSVALSKYLQESCKAWKNQGHCTDLFLPLTSPLPTTTIGFSTSGVKTPSTIDPLANASFNSTTQPSHFNNRLGVTGTPRTGIDLPITAAQQWSPQVLLVLLLVFGMVVLVSVSFVVVWQVKKLRRDDRQTERGPDAIPLNLNPSGVFPDDTGQAVPVIDLNLVSIVDEYQAPGPPDVASESWNSRPASPSAPPHPTDDSPGPELGSSDVSSLSQYPPTSESSRSLRHERDCQNQAVNCVTSTPATQAPKHIERLAGADRTTEPVRYPEVPELPTDPQPLFHRMG